MPKVEIVLDLVPCPQDDSQFVDYGGVDGSKGAGSYDFLCGNCNARLIAAVDRAVYPRAFPIKIVKCPVCGRCNQLPRSL